VIDHVPKVTEATALVAVAEASAHLRRCWGNADKFDVAWRAFLAALDRLDAARTEGMQ
jgi:hypothetical protein